MEGKQIFNAAEAARIVGCTPQEMRFNLEKGVWKFGRVIYPNATGKKLKKYIILRCDLKKYFGLEDDYIVTLKRALIISNLATISLLAVWTSGQALAWKLAATPILWGLVAWLLDDVWELITEFWEEVRRWQKS